MASDFIAKHGCLVRPYDCCGGHPPMPMDEIGVIGFSVTNWFIYK
ncbi:hypothetical protein XSR1_250010 [Xenorhabdus szentirmaii DSM 16338]|uniref:Uncharacterized protein n=1 Tax=Xenorhabdus szentirmaii DSM 16338 TaxID=1427518 RepID=W1IYB0_9GAMM|nr:hypothetical protein XSR1_250010 [Xenorhabdus szentirmaii DSM 16338]